MQFRWVALIALWTCFIGPILGAPSKPASSAHKPAATAKAGKNTMPRPHASR